MRACVLLFPVLWLACASGSGDGSDPGTPVGQGGAPGPGGASGTTTAGVGGNPAGQGGAGSSGAPAGIGGTTAGSGGSSAGSGGNGAGGDAGQGGSEVVGGNGGSAGMGGSSVGSGGGGQSGGDPGGSGGVAGAGGFGGSIGGSGGSGGAGGAPEAKCVTAPEVEVSPEVPYKTEGDSSTYTNYFGAYCDKVGAAGRDTVFKVIPKADGTVVVRLEASGSGYDPVLSVSQGECTVFVTNKDGSCANYSGPGGTEELDVTVSKEIPFWVYVDGVKGSDGVFLLSIQYAGAGGAGGGGVGGNGGAGEGGIGGASGSAGVGGTGGTGGTAGAAGATVAGQSCADPVKVKVEAGKPLEFSGSTAEAKNNFLGYCNAMYDARDQVFEVTSTSAGKLSAKVEPLDPKLDVAIYAHKSACLEILLGSDTNGGKGACSELSGAGVAEALSPLSVEAGAKTYVYVDTNSKNGVKGGPFQITFALELFSGKNPSEGSELYFGLQLSEGDHLSFREVSF